MKSINNLTPLSNKTQRKLRKVNNMIAIYKLRRDNLLEDFDRSYSRSYAKVDNLTASSDSSSDEEVVTTEETKTVTTVEYSDDDEGCPPGSVCPNIDPSEIPRPATPFEPAIPFDPNRSLEFTILNDSIVGLRNEINNAESMIRKCSKAIEEVNSKLDYLYNMLDCEAERNIKSNSWGTANTDSKTWSTDTKTWTSNRSNTDWGVPTYKPWVIDNTIVTPKPIITTNDQEEWNRWDNEDFLKW